MSASRYDIIVTPIAAEDLKDIVRSIAQHSPAAAESVADEIGRRAESLERFPRRGVRAREGAAFGEDVRQLVVMSYRILYSIRGRTVFILRIGHGSRLWLKL